MGKGWIILIDSWDWLVIGRAHVSAGLHNHSSIPWSLQRSLWPQMPQDGVDCIWDT